MKRSFRLLSLLLAVLMLLSLLSACKKDDANTTDGNPSLPGKAIHTAAQAAYLAGDYKQFSAYAKGKAELSRPEGISLTWTEQGKAPYSVKIGESREAADAMTFAADSSPFVFYNAKIACTYFYTVTDADGRLCAEEQFETQAQAPRNLYIDGVTNARDLGGWMTPDGRVRQGMLYRTAKYNADESTEAVVTAEGVRTALTQLGIRTELDLRTVDDNENGGITQSPLSTSVRYISFPMRSGGNILGLNRELLPELFAILADESNYPLVFHCSIGTDRTGMVAFLIGALLGVSEEDLYRDYLFSNFSEIGGMRTPSAVKNYLSELQSCEGDTLSQKAYHYLIAQGVSAADLDAFIALMK